MHHRSEAAAWVEVLSEGWLALTIIISIIIIITVREWVVYLVPSPALLSLKTPPNTLTFQG
jgi:hypothetical protein